MIPIDTIPALLQQIKTSIRDLDSQNACQKMMEMINENLPYYDWVGIYWLVGDELQLGPYVGKETEHTRIPVGQGVCGTAVAENQNIVIEDVREVENYLSCDIRAISEIVVLIRNSTAGITGQIDADSHKAGAFDSSDVEFLEGAAEILSNILQR